ncbi:unnamed protein product [Penicillium crustosum]
MVLMSHALKRSIEDVTMLTAYQLLACACYGPIGSALAHKYGKRPQFIFAAIMGFIGTLRSLRTGLLVMTWTCIISLVSILGGVIAEGLGWRYLFLIHLPFTVVGMLSVFFFLPETQWQARRSHIASPEEPTQTEDKRRQTSAMDMTKMYQNHR